MMSLNYVFTKHVLERMYRLLPVLPNAVYDEDKIRRYLNVGGRLYYDQDKETYLLVYNRLFVFVLERIESTKVFKILTLYSYTGGWFKRRRKYLETVNI